jgi:hypothetical protein
VSVPLVGKPIESVELELMLPVAVSTSWTVPRSTLTERPLVVEAELVENTDDRPRPATTATAATSTA